MKKIVLILIGVIFIVFLGWRIYSLFTGSKQFGMGNRGQAQTVAVETADVSIKPIKEIREFTGTIYPIYKYIIAPKTSGRVIAITKRIGDWVNKGEVIARLEDDEYQQAVLQAEASLKSAKASLTEVQSQLELAKQELERERSLQAKGIASSSELDTASTNYEAQKSKLDLAKAQVEQNEASLKSAKIRLDYTILTATEPGFIGERYVDEGNLLSTNSSLVSIIGIDKVIIQATIIEKDYGRIKIGQAAEIKVDAFSDVSFTGKVARIAPVLEEASRVAKVEVEVENKDRLLKPGMFARISIVLQEKTNAQVIPIAAIVKTGGKEGIFVVEKDNASGKMTAKRYEVESGISTDKEIEIVSPQIKGPVVTLGQHLLQDGGLVTLSDAASTSASAKSSGGPSASEKETGR